MNKWLLLGIFGVAAVAQLAVPASMIFQRESALANGVQYKFKTAPVDPYDAFRGRYVAINVEERRAPNPGNLVLARGDVVYVTVVEGDDGFARLDGVSRTAPDGGDYIKTRVRYSNSDGVTVELPFDRYYMEEEIAPKAERAYREQAGREENEAYVTVRIDDGFAVLEELYIGDQPIVDYVRAEMAE